MTIQTAALTASAKSSSWPLAAPVLSLIGLFFVPGKRRRRWLTLAVLLIASLGALTALSACGGGFQLPSHESPPLTITVNGANASGAIVSSTTVQLTVQ
jgi:lipopolysaccharide export LptBFGC system permease protein LptF